MTVDSLEDRVLKFSMLELEGQPRFMHMGTSYLVNDLWSEVRRLRAEVEGLRSDAELLDALEQAAHRGSCPGVINDDAGRWAVSEDGMQNVPDNDVPIDISTTFFVEADQWRPSIREAIRAWLDAMAKEKP